MPNKRKSLEAELNDLARTDPKVGAAAKRYNEAISSLLLHAELEPEIAKAKRAAVLVAIREKMEQCDQPGVDALIVAAQYRGHHLVQADFDLIFENLSHEARRYWNGECDCGGTDCAYRDVKLEP